MNIPNIRIALYMPVVALVFILVPFVVFAEVSETPVSSIGELIESINDRNWPIAMSIGLMLLVWLIRNLVNDVIPKKYLPYITLAIAVLTETSLRISQYAGSNMVWWHGAIHGVIEGVMVGLCAMGVWSVGAKKLPVRKKNRS